MSGITALVTLVTLVKELPPLTTVKELTPALHGTAVIL